MIEQLGAEKALDSNKAEKLNFIPKFRKCSNFQVFELYYTSVLLGFVNHHLGGKRQSSEVELHQIGKIAFTDFIVDKIYSGERLDKCGVLLNFHIGCGENQLRFLRSKGKTRRLIFPAIPGTRPLFPGSQKYPYPSIVSETPTACL
jgi:hypothetical protein